MNKLTPLSTLILKQKHRKTITEPIPYIIVGSFNDAQKKEYRCLTFTTQILNPTNAGFVFHKFNTC